MNKEIFERSIASVRNGINQKLDYSSPYYGRDNTVRGMVTDMDHFPYTRYFRGVYDSEYPKVMDREAGWRVRQDGCYKGLLGFKAPLYPNFCYEAPCSTVYPCYPQFLERIEDVDAIKVQLNRLCVMKSP